MNTITPSEEQISASEQASGVITLLGAAGLAGLVGWLLRRKPGWLVMTAASLSALAGVYWLFRNPPRHIPLGPQLVVAPCDGEVRQIALVQELRFLKALAYQVTIRVRPGDVQVTRAPATGVVRYRRYQPGGQAGQRNDALWIGIRQQDGARVLVKLTASSFWRVTPAFVGRRITALADLEDGVQQGQVTGHLPLGGEVQVYIPATAQIEVQPGTRVQAGATTLAHL